MSDVFIAHVEEDKDVALAIALYLEETGYKTWTYEVDSIPGPSYLIQTGEAVAASKAVIVVISPDSLSSRQVTKEVVRAHETGKEFVPVLRNITHAEFQNRQPEWREAIGGAASINISLDEIAEITPRISSGLKAMGIDPNPITEASRISQIRKILSGMEKSKVKETVRVSDVVTEENERKADKREKITEGHEKTPQVAKRLTKSGWFWGGIVLFMFAFFVVLASASSYSEKTTVSDRLGSSVVVVIIGLPVMLLAAYFLKRGLNQSIQGKKGWLRTAYILIPIGLFLLLLVMSGLSGSPSGAALSILILTILITFLPLFFIAGYCIRRGKKLRDAWSSR